MRNIKKKEINILLTPRQHAQIARLRETGINMSSLARIALRKYADRTIVNDDSSAKTRRAVLYLEDADLLMLDVIAAREGLSKSEVLRCLLAMYLSENEDALNRLF